MRLKIKPVLPFFNCSGLKKVGDHDSPLEALHLVEFNVPKLSDHAKKFFLEKSKIIKNCSFVPPRPKTNQLISIVCIKKKFKKIKIKKKRKKKRKEKKQKEKNHTTM